MSQSPGMNDKPRSPIYTLGLVPLAVGGEVGCLTIFIVVIALVAGLWLDRTFNTKPVFTLILLLGSAPFSLILTFWVATRSVKRLTASQPPVETPAQSKKEENTSE